MSHVHGDDSISLSLIAMYEFSLHLAESKHPMALLHELGMRINFLGGWSNWGDPMRVGE